MVDQSSSQVEPHSDVTSDHIYDGLLDLPTDAHSTKPNQSHDANVSSITLSEREVSEAITRELSDAILDDPTPFIVRLTSLIHDESFDCPEVTQQEVDGEFITLIDTECERRDGVEFRGLLSLIEASDEEEGFALISVYGDQFMITDPEGRVFGISGGLEVIQERREGEIDLTIYSEGIRLEDPSFLEGSSTTSASSRPIDSSAQVLRDLSIQWTGEEETSLRVNGAWRTPQDPLISAVRFNQFTFTASDRGELNVTGEVELRGEDYRWRSLTLNRQEGELSCGRLDDSQQETFCVHLSALRSALNQRRHHHDD